MTAAQLKTLKKVVKYHADGIAKHRDALRDILTDASELADCCEQANEMLECAVDHLSQLV
jgi:hypothetical protein